MAVDTEKDTQEQREKQKKRKKLPVSKRKDDAEKDLRSNTYNMDKAKKELKTVFN